MQIPFEMKPNMFFLLIYFVFYSALHQGIRGASLSPEGLHGRMGMDGGFP